MSRTGFWFQMARGRAIVRTNAMRDARRIHRAIVSGKNHWGGPLDHIATRILENELTWAVRRAREANRQWREYRALHAQDLAMQAEIDAMYPINR